MPMTSTSQDCPLCMVSICAGQLLCLHLLPRSGVWAPSSGKGSPSAETEDLVSPAGSCNPPTAGHGPERGDRLGAVSTTVMVSLTAAEEMRRRDAAEGSVSSEQSRAERWELRLEMPSADLHGHLHMCTYIETGTHTYT